MNHFTGLMMRLRRTRQFRYPRQMASPAMTVIYAVAEFDLKGAGATICIPGMKADLVQTLRRQDTSKWSPR